MLNSNCTTEMLKRNKLCWLTDLQKLGATTKIKKSPTIFPVLRFGKRAKWRASSPLHQHYGQIYEAIRCQQKLWEIP